MLLDFWLRGGGERVERDESASGEYSVCAAGTAAGVFCAESMGGMGGGHLDGFVDEDAGD